MLNKEDISHGSLLITKTKDTQLEETYISTKGLNNMKLIIYSIGFSLGLFFILELPIFYIEKRKLKLKPDQMNNFDGVIYLSYSIKPIIAFIIDNIKQKIGFKKIMVIISILDFFLLLSVYKFEMGVLSLLFTLFFHQIFMVSHLIIAETIIIILSKKINTVETEDNSNTLLSSFFMSRNIGIWISYLFVGKLIKETNPNFVFFISSFFSLLIIIIALNFNEKELEINKTSNKISINEFLNQIKTIFRTFDKHIILLTIFVFLLNSCPSYDNEYRSYFEDILTYDEYFFSNMKTIGLIFYTIALLNYNLFFKNINYKIFYIVTSIILLFLMMSNYIWINEYNKTLGIGTKTFAYLTTGLTSFFAELNLIPILNICIGICPKNLEATTFAIFSSILNFSGTVSLIFGSICINFVNLNRKNYSNFWILIVIQSIYYIIFMIFLFFLKFPILENQTCKKLKNIDN